MKRPFSASTNWSASPYPSGNDTAFFANSGSGQTLIDLAGLSSIRYITYDSPAVAAYINGTGAANSQTLVLADNGEIKLTDTAANSQLFNGGVQLGVGRDGYTYTLNNLSTSKNLTFNNLFGPASGGTAGNKTLVFSGAGNTTILGSVNKGGASNISLTDASSGSVTVMGTNTWLTVNMTSTGLLVIPGSNMVTTLNMNGSTNSVVDIGDGFLGLNNGGSTTLASTQGGTINGTGKLWLSGISGGYADNYVALGKTLTINTSIISAGGFEFWGPTPPYGTFVLNATNTFNLDVLYNQPGTISAWKIGNKGSTTSNLGKGNNITFNANVTPGPKLIYTGTGEDSDRTLNLTYGAVIDHSGTGTLKFTAPLTASGNPKTLILQGSTSGIGEIAGAIPNAGTSLEKNGSGTWVLSAANTYTGTTVVKGGKLLIKSPGSLAASSTVTVNSGAILGGNGTVSGNVILTASGMLAPADLGTFGTLSLGGTLSMTNGRLSYDVSNSTTDKVTVASALSLNGTNTVFLTLPDGILQAGSYTLMTFASLSGTGSFVLASDYENATLVTNGTSLKLEVSGAGTYNKTWKGNVSGLWNTTELNWTNGSAAVNFVADDDVLFDDTASTFNVGSEGAVQPGSVLFNNSLNAYTVSAAMEGSAELFKFGTGNVTLSGTNTLSGPTTIAAGTLTIGATGVLGGGNYATNIINNGALDYASAVTQTNSGVISGAGDVTFSGSGMLTLSGNNTYNGKTTVSGPGTLVLSGANAYNGETLVNAGVLKIQNANALGTTAQGTTVAAGATLELAGNITTSSEMLHLFGTLSSQTGSSTYAGAVSIQPGASFAVGAGSTNTLSVSTTGAGAFTKTGAGLLRLTQDPNHTGTLTINGGTVELAGNTTDGDFVINSSGTLIGNAGNAIYEPNNVTVNAGGFYVLRQSDVINMFSGAGTLTQDTPNSATLTVGNNNNSSLFSGVIENGAGTMGFAKNGIGIQTLSGLNTYTGLTTVTAGTLSLRGPTALPPLSPISMNAATLQILQDGAGNNGTISVGNSITLNAGVTATIDVGNNGSANTGNTVAFGALNNGTSSSANASVINFTGTSGYLQSFASLALPGASGNSTWLRPTTTSVTITGNVFGQALSPASGQYDTLFLEGTSANNRILGVISDSPGYGGVNMGDVRVTKQNSSTWTLAGANTYRGDTTVNGGALIINGSIVTNAFVNIGGTLGGSGTIGGNVTANAGGNLAPGAVNAVGTLSISRTLTLNGNLLLFDVSNVATDKVAVASSLTVNGVNAIALSFPDGAIQAGTYTLMTFASRTGTGTFTLVPAYANCSLVTNATSVALQVSGTTGFSGLTWKGNQSGIWNASVQNWTNSSGPVAYADGNSVTFDDTAIGNFNVTSDMVGIAPAAITFNNGANNYSVTAPITNTAPLVKLGGGTVTLAGMSAYNPLSISVGAGTLTFGGASQLNNGLYTGDIVNNGTLAFMSSASQTNSSVISGAGALAFYGSGTVMLFGTNIYSGATTVNAGVLKLQNGSGLGSTAAGTTVAAGATLELAGDITTLAEALTLAGTLSSQAGSNTYAGIITLQPGAAFNVGAASTNFISASTPANGYGFNKVGAGTLRFTADPNQSGPFMVNEGTLDLFHPGSTDAPFIIAPGATLRLFTANDIGDGYAFTNNGTFDMRASDNIATLNGSGLVTVGAAVPAVTLGIGADNKAGTFSGVIENGLGTCGLTKNGTGVQILSGANTYTGLTTVSAGTLLVNNSLANSAVTVNNNATLGGFGTINGPVNMLWGATLTPSDTNIVGTLTLANNSTNSLTLNGNTLRMDISNSAGVSDKVEITGATGTLALNGKNYIAPSFPSGVAPQGTYTLMSYASKTGTGTLELLGSYPNATLSVDGTSVTLTVGVGGTYGLTWKGNVSGVWDNAIKNWTNGTASVSYTDGDNVTFDDSATGNFTVSSISPVSPSSILFNNSVNAYTVTAAITNTAPLIKLGSNIATLSGVSTYNPLLIDISIGTLILSGASQLNSGNYAGNINNKGTFTITSSAPQSLSGVITGSGALTKFGSGTLTLWGTNSYAGATTINAGVLKILNNTALGTTAAGTTVATNATLELAGNIATPAETLALNGTLSSQTGSNTYAGTITLGVGAFVDVGVASTNIIAASIAGAGAFTKTGGGLMRLMVDPNYTGVMTINGGAVELAANTADGDYVINNGGTLIGNSVDSINNLNSVTVNAGGVYMLRQSDTINMFSGAGTLTKDTVGAVTLTVGNNNGTSTFSGVIENGFGTMSFVKNGTGIQTLSGVSTFTGGTTINTGILMLDGAGLLGNGLYAGAIVNKATLVYASSAPQTLSGVISDVGALRKIGTGKLILSGINTYTGTTSISNGVLIGVTGGGCTNSAVTVQASGSGATAVLGVRYTGANAKWTCNTLTTSAGVSAPRLQFTFDTTPSTTVAPLETRGNVTFDATTTLLAVLPANTGAGAYPLVLAGGTPSGIPTLTPLGNGLSGSLAWGGGSFSANTLVLTITSTGATTQPLKWNQTTAGTWDINNVGNMIWKDNVGTSTNYQEGIVGDHVVFDDTALADHTTVTLNTTVNPSSVVFSNTTFSYTLSGSGAISGDAALTKSGTNMVTLANANTYIGGSTVNAGILKIASGGSINHAAGNIVVGTATSSSALLKIESGASVLSKWIQSGTAANAVGAIHNKGALALFSMTSDASSFALGYAMNGYGYYRHDTAKGLTIGESGIAGANGGNGVMDIVQGVITNTLYFIANRGNTLQYAQVNVTGGSLLMPDSNANAALFWQGGASGLGVINVSESGRLGSLGTLTELDLIKASTQGSAMGVLNIFSNGTVQATRIKASQGNGTALVNFNGGSLKANYSGAILLGNSAVDKATIYSGGAMIDTDGKNVVISQAMLAPTGNGITAIPVTANGKNYIGRPLVYITGGGGTGATAVADFNPDSQEVTGITITSPGYGYTSAPTVTFTGGGGTPPTLGTASIAAMTSGGLTKTGAGWLTLWGASTYTGMTTIGNGTLRIGAGNALPVNAPVTLAGGDYDLSGLVVTNGPITVISGSILNGRIKSSAITKTGEGLSTFTASQVEPAPIVIDAGTLLLAGAPSSGVLPGLYEGRVNNNAFDLGSPNPQTAVKLSPTNACRPSANSDGVIWVDNSTYIYTGYLWNRSPTNETWTFCKSFDDSALLRIDSAQVIYNGTWNAVVTGNYVLTPGPHSFEVRLGQGGGGVGQVGTTVPGIGFDRLGRSTATLCVPILDPGDGSLLTRTILTGTNQLATASTMRVAANATLNLGGTVQTLAEVTGSGLVTNGLLTVTGLVAPGGTNVIGTLTLATTNTLTGTLRVDVSEDGSCDVLAVKGDVDLTGMALNVNAIGQLNNRSLQYTILTCTGTRTGTFGTKTIPSGWMVSYENNGDVKLVFIGGTMIRVY